MSLCTFVLSEVFISRGRFVMLDRYKYNINYYDSQCSIKDLLVMCTFIVRFLYSFLTSIPRNNLSRVVLKNGRPRDHLVHTTP